MRISDWSSDVCSSDLLDKLQADGCRQVALSSARRAEQDEIGALFKPSVARGHGRDLRPRDHRHGVEGEAVERFARWYSCVAQMTFDPTPVTFGHFILGKCSAHAGRSEQGSGGKR